MHPKDKPRTMNDYDAIVWAEIPDPKKHPVLHKAVTRHMVHKKCGEHHIDGHRAKCWIDGKCKGHMPKEFSAQTTGIQNIFQLI